MSKYQVETQGEFPVTFRVEVEAHDPDTAMDAMRAIIAEKTLVLRRNMLSYDSSLEYIGEFYAHDVRVRDQDGEIVR